MYTQCKILKGQYTLISIKLESNPPHSGMIVYVTHSVRSSPSVGIVTSGLGGGGGWFRGGLGAGCISIIIMITRTKAERVTGIPSVSFSKRGMGNATHQLFYAYCPI